MGRGQRTEGSRQRAEGRGQRADLGRNYGADPGRIQGIVSEGGSRECGWVQILT